MTGFSVKTISVIILLLIIGAWNCSTSILVKNNPYSRTELAAKKLLVFPVDLKTLKK